MKPERPASKPLSFIDSLLTRSRHTFTLAEAIEALGTSPAAVKAALGRMTRKTLIASPAKGFYVIVSPEYRALGCLPADQFIPDLMRRTAAPYYVGLLAAAQYHGAAHQQPMEFQVFVSKSRRPIRCGRVRVAFLAKRSLANVPVQKINTPTGTLTVSTPEATAFDLVGYYDRAAGFSNVVTVLSELAERLDPQKLAKAAEFFPVPWAQRLGYILDHVEASDKTAKLRDAIRGHVHETVPLRANGPQRKSSRDEIWKIYVNTPVEPDL